MPATVAWLHNLPNEQLELVRAISVNLPGEFDRVPRRRLYNPVLPAFQRAKITLYYFHNDFYLNHVTEEYHRLRQLGLKRSQVGEMSRVWKHFHRRDRHVNAGGSGDQFDSDGYESDDHKDEDARMDSADEKEEDEVFTTIYETDFDETDEDNEKENEEVGWTEYGEEEHEDDDEGEEAEDAAIFLGDA